MIMKELVNSNVEVLKQRPISVREWEIMNGREKRAYLAPLSWKERATFMLTSAQDFESLPWEERREIRLESIEKLESQSKLSLGDKVNLAFLKGSVKIGDWLNVRLPEQLSKGKELINRRSPYVATEAKPV